MGTERDFKVKKGLKVEDGDITIPSDHSVFAGTFDTNVASAGVTLSGTTLAADGTDTNIGISVTPKGSGSVTISKVDINGGTIDGATIATSNITVGNSKTLDVSAGTLTLADDQISGDKIDGGTIGSVTITTPTITNVPSNIQAQDNLLDRLSDLVMGADKIAYFTGANAAAMTSFTSQARALLDDTSFSDMRTTLGAQAQNDILDDIAGLTQQQNKIIFFNTATSAATATLSMKQRSGAISA